MAHPLNPQQMATNWEQGIAQTDQQRFCARQVALGVNPAACATRFQMWQQRVQGKAQRFIQGWQAGA
jgi:hypothetical protein